LFPSELQFMSAFRIWTFGIIILITFLSCNIFAQEQSALLKAESDINSELSTIMNSSPLKREAKAASLFEKVLSTLELDGTFNFPFDSLKKIGKIYSPDHRLRIYTWNIPVGVDQNLYYAVFQYYSKRDKKYYLQKAQSTDDFKGQISLKNWPGALYYETVETKHAGQKYYTLLGLDMGNMLTNKKVIDVVSIDDFDSLYFCHDLIKYNDRMADRVVFEFNEQVTMTLKYNPTVDMIVFDHLSPEKPSLEGNYVFYGPDFSYDGLKFEKGIWVQYKNLNVTN
jgi:hypothetical protein